MGRPQSADKKFVRARGPQNWNPESVRPNEVYVREPLHVLGVALNNRELLKAEGVRVKSVRAKGPIKMKKMKGAFSLNNLLVGTVRPPDSDNLKVPKGHHPRGTTLCEALRGNLPLRGVCGGLSEGSVRSLRGFSAGSLRGSAGVRGIFPRSFGGSDPMLVFGNCWRNKANSRKLYVFGPSFPRGCCGFGKDKSLW